DRRYMQLFSMRRFILLITFFPTFLFGQDMSNSIGIVTLNDETYNKENGLFQFLNEDGSIWYEFTFYYDDSDGKWDYPNDEFKIVVFHPDYFLFKIKCVSESENFYTVLVNEKTGLTKRLKKSAPIKLQNWEQYVLNVFSVDFDPSELPVYNRMNGTPMSELPKQESILVPKEIKGDWMRIIWSNTGEYPDKSSEDKTGWIRWKTSNKINVTIFHIS
ncbi:MAG: hypothetical protein OCD76_25790, partial [Reichenbachiella sp.]